MISLELKLEGNFIEHFQKKIDEIPDKLSEVVNESALAAQGILMSNAPRDIGNLAGSHRVESNGPLERVIFPDEGVAPYALFVVLGTKPHDIYPLGRASYLGNDIGTRNALFWPGADHPVKKVNHPGTKAQPYIQDSIPEIRSKIESNLEDFKQWLMEG